MAASDRAAETSAATSEHSLTRRRKRGPFVQLDEFEVEIMSRLGRDEFCVYVRLARRADSETAQCWPGRSLLATETGMSERAVDRSMARLRDAGVLSVRRRGLGLTNVYELHPEDAQYPESPPVASLDSPIPESPPVSTLESPPVASPESSPVATKLYPGELDPVEPDPIPLSPRVRGETPTPKDGRQDVLTLTPSPSARKDDDARVAERCATWDTPSTPSGSADARAALGALAVTSKRGTLSASTQLRFLDVAESYAVDVRVRAARAWVAKVETETVGTRGGKLPIGLWRWMLDHAGDEIAAEKLPQLPGVARHAPQRWSGSGRRGTALGVAPPASAADFDALDYPAEPDWVAPAGGIAK